MVKNNSRFDIAKVTVKHNYNNGSNNTFYSPDSGVYIEVGRGTWGNLGYTGLGVDEARELAEALNTLANEVEARKPREKTLQEKLVELPDGAVIDYLSKYGGKSPHTTYHKLGGKFYRESNGDSYAPEDFPGVFATAYIDGEEL